MKKTNPTPNSEVKPPLLSYIIVRGTLDEVVDGVHNNLVLGYVTQGGICVSGTVAYQAMILPP